MAIVCTNKKTTWIRLVKWISGPLISFMFSMSAFAASPTATACNAALAANYPVGQGVKIQDMDFGSFLLGTKGGTATIDPQTGTVSVKAAGGAGTPPTWISGGQYAIVHFDVSGPGAGANCIGLNTTVTITPGSITNGSSTMTVDNFKSTTDLASQNLSSKFSATGDYYIGGDLTIIGSETLGNYNGSAFTITISF